MTPDRMQPQPPPWLAEAQIGLIWNDSGSADRIVGALSEAGYRQIAVLGPADVARLAANETTFDLLVCQADDPGRSSSGRPETLALANKLHSTNGTIAITQRDDARWILGCIRAGAATCHLESDGREALLQLVYEQLRRGDGPSGSDRRRKAQMRRRLAASIKAGAIDMHFQPIVETRTGRVTRVEALARWTDEEFGYVIPSEFVHTAEREGLADELGRLALRKSIAMLQRLRKQGRHLSCSVNVSRKQFENPSLANEYQQIAAELGEPTENITIEVTETARYRNESLARSLMNDLKQGGFGLSIDDFGAGESSFAQLANPAYREIKIDRSLVALIDDRVGQAVLQSILQLARALGLALVAEGVETTETAQALVELDVDYCQGYHFARPLSEPALLKFLEQRGSDNGQSPKTGQT